MRVKETERQRQRGKEDESVSKEDVIWYPVVCCGVCASIVQVWLLRGAVHGVRLENIRPGRVWLPRSTAHGVSLGSTKLDQVYHDFRNSFISIGREGFCSWEYMPVYLGIAANIEKNHTRDLVAWWSRHQAGNRLINSLNPILRVKGGALVLQTVPDLMEGYINNWLF